jgi:16S rRNA (uracil1498-N3)-methyltransferase
LSIRFYCPNPPRDGRIRLDADEARHMTRVCRLGLADRVEIFDGRGYAALCEIVAIGDDSVELGVRATLSPRLPPLSLTLATAVAKGDRFDWLVEKATELGVERLIPLVTARSVVTPGPSKLIRLERSIIEASKQCRRHRLMVLDPPITWTELVASRPDGVRFLADPDGDPPTFWPTIVIGQEALLAVGPEGGFTDQERNLARECGWHAISLSVNTLRIETAGLAGCAALLSRAGETPE